VGQKKCGHKLMAIILSNWLSHALCAPGHHTVKTKKVHKTTMFLLVTLPNIHQFTFFYWQTQQQTFLNLVLTTLKYVATLCKLALIDCFLTLKFHKVVWQHMQVLEGFLITRPVYCKFTKESFSKNFFVHNRLKFDRLMAMSLWPHFFDPPCTWSKPLC